MSKGFMAFDGSKSNSQRKRKSISYSSRMKTSCDNTVLKYSPHLLGGYKQKIKTLSENNKALVEALENYRYQCSVKEKTLIQVSTTALQNSISAKAKLNKLFKDLTELLLSVEEIMNLMDTNSSVYPTMFVPNTKPKKPRECLSRLIESISEETSFTWEDFSITKPHSSLGENKNCKKNGNTKSPSSLIPTKRFTESKKINQKKIPSIQKQSKAKVLETSSESLLRKQDFSSDTPKPLPSNKRCRNLSEVQLHQDVSNLAKRKKQKPNPLCESEKTIKKNKHQTVNLNTEPSVDKILPNPVIYVINTDQPQANLQDVTVEEFYATNNVLDKPNEDIALQKCQIISKESKIKLDSKAGKTKRHTKKNSDENPGINITSSHRSKRTKILAKPLKPQVYKDENKSESNNKVGSFDEEKCFEKSNASEYLDPNNRTLQETIESREQVQKKQVLCSVENVPSDEAEKTTVTAEIHNPPSNKLAEKKAYSNAAIKIMQPCVVLTDIRDTSLLIESDDGDCFVEAPSLKVQNKEDMKEKTKLKLTGRKKYKTKGSLPSHANSSRSCRSRPVVSYKENSLNKKMRRS